MRTTLALLRRFRTALLLGVLVATIAQRPEAQQATRRVVVNGADLTGVGHDRGRPDAPIVIVEFSDFGCPYCGRHARETFPALEREFIATGKVFYKYVPFVMGGFRNGRQAARAAECAADQRAFWAMHDTLYARQAEWRKSITPVRVLGGYAAQLGLDAKQFEACYLLHEPHHPRTRVADDRAGRLGIRATPTFFINGRMGEGALPLEQFRALLHALERGARPSP